jgi:hypothetical protein
VIRYVSEIHRLRNKMSTTEPIGYTANSSFIEENDMVE